MKEFGEDSNSFCFPEKTEKDFCKKNRIDETEGYQKTSYRKEKERGERCPASEKNGKNWSI
jgi:hypothetical protein